MALGMVQAGYGNSLYTYSAHSKTEAGSNYEEFLTELATELELALEGSSGEAVREEANEGDVEQPEEASKEKKEWEDLLQQSEAREAVLQNLLEEGLGQQKKEETEKEQKENADATTDGGEELFQLIAESTQCICEEESGEEIPFLTFYTKKGIFCKEAEPKNRAGKRKRKRKEWFVPFLNVEEYEKAIAFLRQFPEELNLPFTASEWFWLDFLDNTLEFGSFFAVMEGRKEGHPEQTEYLGNSEFLQTKTGSQTEYWNPLGSGGRHREYLHSFCYTCETKCNRKERWKRQME